MHSNGSPADVKGSPLIENNPRPRKMAAPPVLQPTQHKMSCHHVWITDKYCNPCIVCYSTNTAMYQAVRLMNQGGVHGTC